MNRPVKTWVGVAIIIIMAITAIMFVWKYYSLNPIPDSEPQIVQVPKLKAKENIANMANPASVFCEENGGKLEIVTAEDGGQSGMCKFPDGSDCEEWAFMRGECNQNEIDTSDWQTYKNEEYGFEFKYPSNDYDLDDLASFELNEYSKVLISLSDIEGKKISEKCNCGEYQRFQVRYSNDSNLSLEDYAKKYYPFEYQKNIYKKTIIDGREALEFGEMSREIIIKYNNKILKITPIEEILSTFKFID